MLHWLGKTAHQRMLAQQDSLGAQREDSFAFFVFLLFAFRPCNILLPIQELARREAELKAQTGEVGPMAS